MSTNYLKNVPKVSKECPKNIKKNNPTNIKKYPKNVLNTTLRYFENAPKISKKIRPKYLK